MAPQPQKKKILFISTKSVLGGAQRYIVDLIDYLPRDEFDISVGAGGHGPLEAKLRERAIPYYEIAGLGKNINPLKDIACFFRMVRLIKKINPDIVHLNSSKASFLGAFAARVAGVRKIVSSTHGWPFLEDRPRWQRSALRLLTKIGVALQDSIICVSLFDYNIGTQDRIASAKKLVPIHNGIDPARHLFLDKQKAREYLLGKEHIPQKNYFIVGTIAEYTKNKGLFYLIEAAPHIVKFEPNTLFFLIGWGEEKHFFKHHIRINNLENHVFLIDYLPEAFTYLKALDVFVLPSTKEGFAYTLLEASLAGLPIITTHVGGNPEIIENFKNGLLITPASPQEIIDAISRLMRDPKERAALGQKARKKVLTDFSISSMIEATKKVYTS